MESRFGEFLGQSLSCNFDECSKFSVQINRMAPEYLLISKKHRIVPSLASIGGLVAAQLGDPTAAAFFISMYTMTVTIAFMVGGFRTP